MHLGFTAARECGFLGRLTRRRENFGGQGEGKMIVKTLIGLSLVISASIDTQIKNSLGATGAEESALHMSARQKNAAVRPLVRSATECVARTVSANAQFAEAIERGDINDLIVDSMASCVDAMRAMIDGYDRYYGAGAGETFFAGPYLDVLPAAVHKLLDRDGK
jgi:hypothetical protein